MGTKVKRVFIQASPRMDSLTALYLLMQTEEGRRRYPGVETARIEYWGTGTIDPKNRTWQEHFAEGTILIGVGGGPFDEHPSPGFGDRKKDGLSSTLLVARDLGIEDHPLYKRLVATVTRNDLNPVSDITAMSHTIKLMHRMPNSEPDEVIRWAFHGIDALVSNQERFVDAMQQFAEEAEIRTVQGYRGPVKIAFIRSDNDQMGAAARYHHNNLAVLVQYRGSGRVQIFGSQRLGVSLRGVARAIRFHELIARGRERDAKDYKDTLSEPGQLTLVPNWCYQKPGENILNGSETAPDLEPTRLMPRKIMDIVYDYLEFNDYEVNSIQPVEATA